MFNSFTNSFVSGLKYAVIFVAVSFFMGIFYGVWGLNFMGPACFAVSLTGIVALLNFPIALIAFTINLIPSLFKKGIHSVTRYFAISMAFMLIYMCFFLFMKYSGFEPF